MFILIPSSIMSEDGIDTSHLSNDPEVEKKKTYTAVIGWIGMMS